MESTKKRVENLVGAPHYTLTHIYQILDTIDKDALGKIAKNEMDKLTDEVKVKITELRKIANVLGWDQGALSKAITLEIKKR